jgi:hypothetical protein
MTQGVRNRRYLIPGKHSAFSFQLCDLCDYFAYFAFKRRLSNRKGREEGAKNAKLFG